MHFWPKFGNNDFNLWWLIARTSSKWGKFWLLSLIWPWSSKLIIPQNNRDLNQGLLHLWFKIGDSSLKADELLRGQAGDWRTDTRTHTHTGNDNTRRPKLASGKNINAHLCFFTTNSVPQGLIIQENGLWYYCTNDYNVPNQTYQVIFFKSVNCSPSFNILFAHCNAIHLITGCQS